MRVGCKLGIFTSNVVAYADDVMLLAPIAPGLQMLIDEVMRMTRELKLEVNKEKTKCMVFHKSRFKSHYNRPFRIDNADIQYVSSFKYLGFMLRGDLNNVDDINRVLKKFYKEFNCLLRKFSFTETEVMLYLFKQYCLQFYGVELWIQNNRCVSSLKQFGIGYHKAVKKIIGVSYHESNHFACQEANLLTFEHTINKIKISAAYRLMNNPCDFSAKLHDFMCVSSTLYCDIYKILKDKYELESLMENDIDAIMSRIRFTQNHEKQMRSSC